MRMEHWWVLMLVMALIFAFSVVTIGYFNTDWHPEETCSNQCDSLNLSFYNWERGDVFGNSLCFCLTHEGYPIVVGD